MHSWDPINQGVVWGIHQPHSSHGNDWHFAAGLAEAVPLPGIVLLGPKRFESNEGEGAEAHYGVENAASG